MSRAQFLSVLSFLLIISGLAVGDARILVMGLPVALFLLAGAWHAPHGVRLVADRQLSAERIFSGDPVTVRIRIRNEGCDIKELSLEDVLPDRLELVEGSNRRITQLKRGETFEWSYTLTGKRGYFMLHAVKAVAREPLGLSVSPIILPTDGQLFIVPPVLRLKRISIRPRRTRIYSGTIPARQGGSGVEFFDVREYQTGDSPRAINWRLSARHPQAVYSNQYDQERVADVGIILDGRRRTTEFGAVSIFEHSVMATAALVDAFISAGNRVGLLFYGKQIHWTMPGYGKIQGEKILHSLSKLEPGESQVFNELFIPPRLFPSKSQLVLVSPLTPDDFPALSGLRSKGYSLLVVSPDPVSFEASSLPSSEAVSLAQRIIRLKYTLFLRRLKGIGIQVVRWDVSQPFESVARREMERSPVMLRGVSNQV